MKKYYVLIFIICLTILDFFSDRINIIFYPKETVENVENFIKVKDKLKKKIALVGKIEVSDDLVINSCESLESSNLSFDDIKNNSKLYEYYKNCNLLDTLDGSVVAFNKKMTKNIQLSDFSEWSSQLVLLEDCDNDFSKIHKLFGKYETVRDLIDAKIIKAKIKNDHSVIFEFKDENKKMYVKEITRCAFVDDDFQYIILEIQINNLDTNREQCTIYRKYSKYSENEGVLNRKF